MEVIIITDQWWRKAPRAAKYLKGDKVVIDDREFNPDYHKEVKLKSKVKK